MAEELTSHLCESCFCMRTIRCIYITIFSVAEVNLSMYNAVFVGAIIVSWFYVVLGMRPR